MEKSPLCLILAVLTVTTGIEFAVVWLVMKRPSGVWPQILGCVCFMNALTFIPAVIMFGPPCQYLYVALYLGYDLLPGLAVFVFPGLLISVPEFLLLLWLFRRLYTKGSLKDPVSTLRIAAATLAANLASSPVFVVGIWLSGIIPATTPF